MNDTLMPGDLSQIQMPRKALVELEGISKTFLTDEVETLALRGVNLTIFEGDFVVITGSSGCGKSTLLSILAMFDTPSGGTLRLRGQLLNELDVEERTKLRNEQIGYVFQNFNLIGHLTVFQNVELPMTWRSIDHEERRERVMKVLTRVGLSGRANHYPSQLSGGQQQRVAVARAVVGNPAMILADEPTGNLDSKNAGEIVDLLHNLHEGGATLIMVTHQPNLGIRSTRTIQINDGQITGDARHQRADVPVSASN